MAEITHVKEQESGYRVTYDDGHIASVPPGHRFVEDIQAWLAAGNTAEPVETAAERTARLKSYAHQKRDAVERGGFTFNGNRFQSDQSSFNRIIGTVGTVNAGKGVPSGFAWRTVDNQDVTMSGADMQNLMEAFFNHANVAHATLQQVKADIDGGTITSEAEIDAAGWPS